MLNIVSAKLTGTPGSTGWAQVHEFVQEDPEKISRRGNLFVIIATSQVEHAPGVDVIAAGRELLSRVNEEYYGKLDTQPFFALKSAIQKVSEEFGKNWGNVEIAGLAALGDVVYVAAQGGCEVLISRGGSMATVLKSNVGETSSASGYPKNGDVILLATRSFLSKVPQGVMKAALSNPTPEEAAEALAPLIHGSEDAGDLCAEILYFGFSAPLKPAVVVPVEETSKTDFLQKFNKFVDNLGKKIPRRSIYIKPAPSEEVSPQSKKLTFSVAVILLVLLAVSIGFGIRQKKINDLKGRYQGVLQQAISEADQAISLASVSPDRSRELFADARTKLAQIEGMKVKDPALAALRQKISDGRSSILGEYDVQLEMFLDLTLLSSGFKGGVISFSGGQIYVLDSSGGRVVSVEISGKKSKVVAGPGAISSATSLAGYESRVFVLEGDGIYEIESGSTKVVSKTWSGDALISAFAGNLYVIDKSGGAVYRYQGQGGSFGDKQNWLAAGTNVTFANASQMAVDGSIYVLFPNSKILKFSQGSPQNFSIKGTIPEIGNVDAISTGPDNQYVYLLDRAGKRVVVTDKKGIYKAQYINDAIAGAINLVVSEPDKKIILLTGDRLYSINISNF